MLGLGLWLRDLEFRGLPGHRRTKIFQPAARRRYVPWLLAPVAGFIREINTPGAPLLFASAFVQKSGDPKP